MCTLHVTSMLVINYIAVLDLCLLGNVKHYSLILNIRPTRFFSNNGALTNGCKCTILAMVHLILQTL